MQLFEATETFSVTLDNEAETVALGKALVEVLTTPCVVYLHGELGAGKTTFVRGLLQGLGHQGAVKSPTYTLVEPYELAEKSVYHFDLYRLADAEELEYIGIREYQHDKALLLFEWPDKGAGMIPAADLELFLAYQGEGRVAKFRFNVPVLEQKITQNIRQKLANLR